MSYNVHLYLIYSVVYIHDRFIVGFPLSEKILALFLAVSQDLEWCLAYRRSPINICLTNERVGVPLFSLTYLSVHSLHWWDLLSERQIWPHYLMATNAPMPSSHLQNRSHLLPGNYGCHGLAPPLLQPRFPCPPPTPRPHPPNMPAMSNDHGVPKHAMLFLPSVPSQGIFPKPTMALLPWIA